jgi:hypothetical protein
MGERVPTTDTEATPSPDLRLRLRRATVLAVLTGTLVGDVAFVATSYGIGGIAQHLVTVVPLTAYAVVGGVILWRRNHPIGWLLLVMGLIFALDNLLQPLMVRPEPPGSSVPWSALIAIQNLLFPLFVMLLPTLGLRFPDGKPLSRRWRLVEPLYVVGVASVVGAMLLTPTLRGGPPDAAGWTLPNPLSRATPDPLHGVLELIAPLTLAPAIVLAILALILRFRRSRGLERQQLRWLLFPLATVALSWPLVAGSALLVFGSEAAELVSATYSILVLAVPPLGMGVAITRHGLYDLQRLISRTVAYATLTLLLATLYAGAVLILGTGARTMTGGGSGDVTVALSTLVVAGAFGPLRRRVQHLVDRRFNRRRADAAATVERFGQRLRDEVDLHEITTELKASISDALAPGSVSLMLAPRRGTG